MIRSDQTTHDDRELWQSWWDAAGADPVRAEIPALYEQLDQQIAEYEPKCFTSGRCCQFDAFGHRLYVTGLEVAWMLAQLAQSSTAAASSGDASQDAGRTLTVLGQSQGADLQPPADWADVLPDAPQDDGCPFQIEKKCTTHVVRPMGCRIFFCQQGTEAWQQDLYEQYLRRLRDMHEQQQLDYRYVEWRYALAEAAKHLPIKTG